MMRYKRVLLLLLASAGIVSLGLAGCSQRQDLGVKAQESTTTAQTETAPAQDVRRDVPYVPTPEAVVQRMLELAKVSKNDLIYDLGSGDGRIVITAAKQYGAQGIGVDIDPDRIREANENARKAGVIDRVQFLQQDLFKTDISKATVVTLYLLPEVNLKLRPTLLKLKPGTRIVSHAFDMGDWKPERVEQVDGRYIYYWVVPEKAPANLQ